MPQKPLWGGGCECPLPPRRNTLHGKAQLRWFQLPVALWPKSLQGPSIDQRKVNHMMHWWQKYLSERLHPACTDMKGAPADKTKSVNVTPKMWLVSPVKLIQWFLPSHFCEVPQKKRPFLTPYIVFQSDCATLDQLTLNQAKICGESGDLEHMIHQPQGGKDVNTGSLFDSSLICVFKIK